MASAAVIGAAVIGAVGSNMAANKQSSAAKKAANAQVAAAEGTNALDLAMYSDQRDLMEGGIWSGAIARARQMVMMGYPREDVKSYLTQMRSAIDAPGPALNSGGITPRRDALRGTSGFGDTDVGHFGQAYRNQTLAELDQTETTPLASGAPGATGASSGAAPAEEDPYAWVDDWQWEQTPSYQFRLDEGTEAINRNLAARGLYGSGAAARRLTEFGQDLASEEFGDVFGYYGNLAGQGQQNANTVVNVGSQTAGRLGDNMRYAGDARATGYRQAGAAQAAGIQGVTNSITGALGAYGSYNGWWG